MTNPVTTCPSDPFFAEVVSNVHKHLEDAARRRLRNQQTFTIPELARLAGLSAPEVRYLILDQEIDANQTRSGTWLIPSDEVRRVVQAYAPERNCQAGLAYLAAAEAVEEDEGMLAVGPGMNVKVETAVSRSLNKAELDSRYHAD